MSLPQEFERRMQRLLGEEYPLFVQAMARPQARGLRVNPLKIQPDAFARMAPFSLEQVPWVREGFFYSDEQKPGRHVYYDAGLYYIQEPSAMAVGTLADAQPGERILDLCAAPGGKTTHLAGCMDGKGILVANEIHAGRASVLAQNVERMGVSNCVVVNETPQRLAVRFPHWFDCVIVDAPCSGEGMFRKDDNPAQQEWTPELPVFCAERQAEILDCAAAMLRGGGRLVYSTCTFAPEENEGTLSRFLARHPEFEMVHMDRPPDAFAPARPDWVEHGNASVASAFRLWPHKLRGEGHFAAVLRRTDDAADDVPQVRGRNPKELPKEWTAFAAENLCDVPKGVFVQRRDHLDLLPAGSPDMAGLHIKRAGLELGTLRKNRFEPSHALAHARRMDTFCRTCELDARSDTVLSYLRGETFPWNGEKGWTAVCVDGFPLGWGKCAGGIMKNHYPKGLRRLGGTK